MVQPIPPVPHSRKGAVPCLVLVLGGWGCLKKERHAQSSRLCLSVGGTRASKEHVEARNGGHRESVVEDLVPQRVSPKEIHRTS